MRESTGTKGMIGRSTARSACAALFEIMCSLDRFLIQRDGRRSVLGDGSQVLHLRGVGVCCSERGCRVDIEGGDVELTASSDDGLV